MDINTIFLVGGIAAIGFILVIFLMVNSGKEGELVAALKTKIAERDTENRELRSQITTLRSRNALLEDGNSLKKVFGTELSYVVAIHDILDPLLPPMQSMEHLIASLTPEMQKTLNIPLMQETQLAVAGLTKQELEAMHKLRHLLLRLTIVTRDETMKMIVNTRLTSAHLLALKELFTRAGDLLPHLVENPVMFEEAIRQLTLDIQRQRDITNPKGLNLDKTLYEQVRQSYAPIMEAAVRKQKSLEDTQPNPRTLVADEQVIPNAHNRERFRFHNPNQDREK